MAGRQENVICFFEINQFTEVDTKNNKQLPSDNGKLNLTILKLHFSADTNFPEIAHVS